MQIIGPYYTKESYTKDAVDTFIGEKYPDFRYYGFYPRKNYTSVNVYRYYKRDARGQKKRYPYCPRFCFHTNRNP
jgi:hypothetical protein